MVGGRAEDACDYCNGSSDVLRSGDLLTWSPTTATPFPKPPLFRSLMIGSVDRSSDVNLSETGNQDGK